MINESAYVDAVYEVAQKQYEGENIESLYEPMAVEYEVSVNQVKNDVAEAWYRIQHAAIEKFGV